MEKVSALWSHSGAKPAGHLLLHGRVFAEALDPLDARLAPEPGELALGVMAHVELRLLNCALKRTLAAEVFDDAPVAVRAEGARLSGDAAQEEAAHLFDETRAEARLGPHVDEAGAV